MWSDWTQNGIDWIQNNARLNSKWRLTELEMRLNGLKMTPDWIQNDVWLKTHQWLRRAERTDHKDADKLKSYSASTMLESDHAGMSSNIHKTKGTVLTLRHATSNTQQHVQSVLQNAPLMSCPLVVNNQSWHNNVNYSTLVADSA